MSESSFVKISLTKHHSETVRTRELKFWEIIHLPLPVTFNVSHVMCHMSHVTFHVSHVMCHMYLFLFFWTKCWSLLVQGLLSTGPRLVYIPKLLYFCVHNEIYFLNSPFDLFSIFFYSFFHLLIMMNQPHIFSTINWWRKAYYWEVY